MGDSDAFLGKQDFWGLAIAGLIVLIWGISLHVLLEISLVTFPLPLAVLLVLWQTFLYTGLFITAHDAMHGGICPQWPKVNAVVGTIALALYGLLPYRKLRHAHILHHCHPATSRDPDFHRNQRSQVFRWYLDFIWNHKSTWSLLGLLILYLSAHGLFKIAQVNLILFWIIPSILSSFQLFYFGTFLAHKEPLDGYKNARRAKTIERPFLWSLISCYHFGYHDEHHQYPQIPWWLLRAVSLRLRLDQITGSC